MSRNSRKRGPQLGVVGYALSSLGLNGKTHFRALSDVRLRSACIRLEAPINRNLNAMLSGLLHRLEHLLALAQAHGAIEQNAVALGTHHSACGIVKPGAPHRRSHEIRNALPLDTQEHAWTGIVVANDNPRSGHRFHRSAHRPYSSRQQG